MTEKRLLNWKQILTIYLAFILIAGVLMLAFPARADIIDSSYILHPDITHYASANWLGYPNSTLWSLLVSNDGDSSYIYSSPGWDLAYFKMQDFSVTGTVGEYYILTFWAIVKISTPLPPNALECIITMAKGMSWYETSEIRYTHIFSVKDQWVNISIMSGQCPWTAANWTVDGINSILYGIAKNGNPGTLSCTEMGLKIDVYVPVTIIEETNFWGYAIIGALIASVVTGMIIYSIVQKEE